MNLSSLSPNAYLCIGVAILIAANVLVWGFAWYLTNRERWEREEGEEE